MDVNSRPPVSHVHADTTALLHKTSSQQMHTSFRNSSKQAKRPMWMIERTHPLDAGIHKCAAAWRRPAEVIARLQRHICRRASRRPAWAPAALTMSTTIHDMLAGVGISHSRAQAEHSAQQARTLLTADGTVRDRPRLRYIVQWLCCEQTNP